MAQEVIDRPATAEALVRLYGNLCEMSFGHSDSGTGFFSSTYSFLVSMPLTPNDHYRGR